MLRRLFLAGFLITALLGCARPASRAQPSPEPSAIPVASAAAAWCHSAPIEKAFCPALTVAAPRMALRLAVADTEARRERGLMGVTALPQGEGMLFAFPYSSDRRLGFWMKDTLIPLDMIFVMTDGTISKIAYNVPATKPGTPDSRVARRSGIGVYVIELRAGDAAAAGLEPGKRLIVPTLSAQ